MVNEVIALPIPCAVVNVTEPAVAELIVSLGTPNVAVRPLTEAALNVAMFEFTTTLMRVKFTVPSAAVT